MIIVSWCKHKTRRLVYRNPWLFLIVYKLIKRRPTIIIRPGSDICVEGYPRSANTYAVMALRLSNPGIKIASHTHSSAQVAIAIKYNIPVLVLLRDPDAAVRSLLVRRQTMTPKQGLREYIDFYSALEPHLSKLLIANFQTVINEFEKVVAAINRRYGTTLNAPANSYEKAQIFNAIEAKHLKAHGGKVNPRHFPAPSPERTGLKAIVSFCHCADELEAANNVYQKLSRWAV